jgi:hypothetical protein
VDNTLIYLVDARVIVDVYTLCTQINKKQNIKQ